MPNCQIEYKQQVLTASWCEKHKHQCEGLGFLIASANDEYREQRESRSGQSYSTAGNRLKAKGVKSGVPDLQLPIPCFIDGQLYTGLYIEMKKVEFPYSDKTSKPLKPQFTKPSEGQIAWLYNLQQFGHFTTVCYTADSINISHGEFKVNQRGAIDVICDYLGIDRVAIEHGKLYSNWFADYQATLYEHPMFNRLTNTLHTLQSADPFKDEIHF